MYQFGWFSTGRDKAARDLFETACNAIKQGDIKAEIAFVFCSREPDESDESDRFIDLVNSYKIPLISYSYRKFKASRDTGKQKNCLPQWRLEYDRDVMERLKDFQPDLCILAGYMLIVGKAMCKRYTMINLHPAAPGGPAGTWQEVIWQLIENNATETGVMMHLVTPELDKGPVVCYYTFPITGSSFDIYWQQLKVYDIDEVKRRQGENNPLFSLIRQHGLKREFPLILATMKVFSQGKVRITDGKVTDSQGNIIDGYNLTIERDKIISE
jgi:folate-dependent phosphoribosylglycinamide formyltransferase PurN